MRKDIQQTNIQQRTQLNEVDHQQQRLGKLKWNLILIIYVPVLVLTPLYTYHMAVSNKQEPPFPHATVTGTACHYPQDIVFRYTMLICSSILALTFHITFRWVENEAIRVGYPLPKSYLFYLAELSILFYGVTIGTIDGKSTGPLHGPCAVLFFIILFSIIINLTVYITKLRAWDTSVMTRSSLFLKQILAFYIAGIWIWCIYGLITQNLKGQDIYVVILQWNSVTINLLWVLTFFYEWKHLNITLFCTKESAPMISN